VPTARRSRRCTGSSAGTPPSFCDKELAPVAGGRDALDSVDPIAENTESLRPDLAASPAGTPATAGERRSENIHDFVQKLQQPSLWPLVVDYVRWQRAHRQAEANGQPLPPAAALAPLSINLDLTTACNYACDHCIDWDILNSKVRYDDAALRESLRVMASRGLKSVILIGGGEPTLYPGFQSMVQYLKELRLQIAVVSNGSRGDRLLQIAPYLRAGDWVRLSLDSGSNEVFRRMHNPSSKTLSLDEICAWVPKIKAVNKDFQFGFSFVITWRGGARGDVKIVENIHEIEQATARAAQSGFDYISFKPFLERTGDGSEVMDPEKTEAGLQEVLARIRAAIDRARRLERPGFRVLESTNLRVLMKGNWRDYTRQPKTCHMQMLRQVVSPLGTFNCPAHRGVAKAKIGDSTVWREGGAGVTATRQLLDGFDASVECREVTCLYHSTNWWLEELVASSAPLPANASVQDRADYFL
jgi:sulfatase maturation enzyme AslB (radical SAM superfamily)